MKVVYLRLIFYFVRVSKTFLLYLQDYQKIKLIFNSIYGQLYFLLETLEFESDH